MEFEAHQREKEHKKTARVEPHRKERSASEMEREAGGKEGCDCSQERVWEEEKVVYKQEKMAAKVVKKKFVGKKPVLGSYSEAKGIIGC